MVASEVLDAAVMVPATVVKLNEPHAPFGQPSGEQAVGGEGAVGAFGAVQVEDVGGLVAEVHEFGLDGRFGWPIRVWAIGQNGASDGTDGTGGTGGTDGSAATRG